MPRWVAICLGAVTALGMQSLFEVFAVALGVESAPVVAYVGLVCALVIGGFVAGHLVGRFHALQGALAAALYILISVSITAVREATTAHQLGLTALPSIDFVRLTITDLLAMTAATWGGWLAARF